MPYRMAVDAPFDCSAFVAPWPTMSDGLVIQCARVDRLGNKHVIDNSVQAPCARCRQRVWISPPAHDLATRGQGIKPICDVCQPATDVTLRDIHGDGTSTS